MLVGFGPLPAERHVAASLALSTKRPHRIQQHAARRGEEFPTEGRGAGVAGSALQDPRGQQGVSTHARATYYHTRTTGVPVACSVHAVSCMLGD